MLHGNGAGIVTKVNGDQVVVLLNEGLEIPMRRQDLVAIAAKQEEAQLEQKHEGKQPPMLRPQSRMFFVKEGVFLAGFSKTPMLVEFSVVNHTDFYLFMVIYKLGRPTNQFLTTLEIKPKSVCSLPESMPMQETNHLVGLAFQIVKHHPDQGDMAATREFRLAFSQTDWKKTVAKIPIVEKEGYLIQLDGEPVSVDPEKLKNQMMSNRPAVPPTATAKIIEFREVDLHIESLTPNANDLTAAEMLSLQMDFFAKAFDKALVDNVKRLILIHGVGNGVLKTEIHRVLSKSPHIKSFKEARKEKFGYGATEVEF